MKRRYALGLLGAVPFGLAYSHYSRISNPIQSPKKCLVEAHRGNSGEAPENTIAAVQEAIEIGVDRVEIDLEYSADEKLVVIHDNTLDRTTNGSGRIGEINYSEIKKLDAGSWKNVKYKGEYVPLLNEIFELCKGKCMVNIDIKNSKAVPKMVKLIEDIKMSDHLVLTGLIPQVTTHIRELGENLTMFYESSPNFKEPLKRGKISEAINIAVTEARQLKLPGFLFKADWITPEIVYQAHLHGLAVNVWNVNTKQMASLMLEANVDAIMTDYPKLII